MNHITLVSTIIYSLQQMKVLSNKSCFYFSPNNLFHFFLDNCCYILFLPRQLHLFPIRTTDFYISLQTLPAFLFLPKQNLFFFLRRQQLFFISSQTTGWIYFISKNRFFSSFPGHWPILIYYQTSAIF